MNRAVVLALVATLLAMVVVGCSSSGQQQDTPGPTVPTGATEIPGGPVQEVPDPASAVIPTSQQQAQDTLVGYLQRTVDALPAGTALDGSRYGPNTRAVYCEDNPADTTAPVHVEDWRDMRPPPATDTATLVAQTGELWRQWGWDVIERDGFPTPNRFGYAPDGYVLQIKARDDLTQPPSVIGLSPCFPGDLQVEGMPRPPLIERSG